MQYYIKYNSPIGELTIVSNETDIIEIWMKNQKYHSNAEKRKITEKQELPILEKTKKWLDRYFDGKNPKISELSLKPEGSEFRKTVWKKLCEIPYGTTTTYGEIAKKVAKILGIEKMSAQAVGGAIGHNPIGIIIPCHRVVGADGNLTGYAGGLDVKKKLLEIEGIDITKFYMPKNNKDKA